MKSQLSDFRTPQNSRGYFEGVASIAPNVEGLCARLEFEKQKIMITKERLVDLICSHSEGATENVADGVMYNILADAILLELQPNGAKPDVMRSLLADIKMIAAHGIPYYAFGDNEAACDMNNRLEEIYSLASNDV